MDFFLILIKAFFLGVIVTAPVGPVGAMVIKRSLKRGFWMGVFTGLGAAFADSSFAWLAVLGIHKIDVWLKIYQSTISLVGGVLLFVIGIISVKRTLKKRNSERHIVESSSERQLDTLLSKNGHWNYFFAFLGSALITYSNPATILGFVGSFAAFGFWEYSATKSQLEFLIVGGVFLGAMSWWTMLSYTFYRVRHRVSGKNIFRIQMFTNGIILLSALYCLVHGFWIRGGAQ